MMDAQERYETRLVKTISDLMKRVDELEAEVRRLKPIKPKGSPYDLSRRASR